MASHIASVSFRGFRRFERLSLEDLGEFNLLVGENNTGKTSVLEGLYLLSDPLNVRTWRHLARIREGPYPMSSLGIVESVAWLFRNPDLPRVEELAEGFDEEYQGGELELRAEGLSGPFALLDSKFTIALESVDPEHFRGFRQTTLSGEGDRQTRLFEQDPDEPPIARVMRVHVSAGGSRTLGNDTTETFRFSDEARFRRGRPPSTEGLFPVEYVVPHDWRSRDASSWTSIVKARIKDEVTEVLRLFDPDLDSLSLVDEGPRSTLLADSGEVLKPSSVYGTGFRRLLSLAAGVVQAKDGILLIDELEEALHPGALRQVFQWLIRACRRNNIQVFASTHSLEAIDALIDIEEELGDALVAYRLRQEESGNVQPKRIGMRRLEKLRFEYGQEIR